MMIMTENGDVNEHDDDDDGKSFDRFMTTTEKVEIIILDDLAERN